LEIERLAGSDGGADRWAIVRSLVETAKLIGVEPFAYLHDVPQRMLEGHPASRRDDLLPWNWHSTAAANGPRTTDREFHSFARYSLIGIGLPPDDCTCSRADNHVWLLGAYVERKTGKRSGAIFIKDC